MPESFPIDVPRFLQTLGVLPNPAGLAHYFASRFLEKPPAQADGVQAQVNLAKLDMHMRQMKKKALPAMKVLGIQAANLLAARSDVRDAKWDPALKAKVRRRCASPLCHSPVPTDGLSADWGAPHALGHRVRHHEGPQQGARSSRWCLSRAQLLTDTSSLRLLDEGRTGAG